MATGVVIPVGAGRQQNVEDCLESLANMNESPEAIVLVLDGHQEIPAPYPTVVPLELVHVPKHEPGMEQPRNVGVRVLAENYSEITEVWFLDSDVLVAPDALSAYRSALAKHGPGVILIGPYEWLPEGRREVAPEVRTDFRWPMFEERGEEVFIADLGVALGCFGGNLMWPIAEFEHVGGFHPQLHHGRCEDGELGLRAASHRIPMALVAGARGYHMAHPVNYELATQRNARDVPLINQWHPWVEQQGLIVTDQDGARFDFVCSCGAQVNTLEMWRHMTSHYDTGSPLNPEGLILPDGL